MKNLFQKFVLALFVILMLLPLPGCFPQEVENANDDPIVLVHGFIGWGRQELGGELGLLYYWGGLDDLEQVLNDAGHECHTAKVGPLSSNWDRACELYAQLKGTRVDYGVAHSIEHKHDRFGRDFTGNALVTDWSSERKIHIFAHSMGGQTCRLLAQMLENGNEGELNAKEWGFYDEQKPMSPLFDVMQDTTNMIHSITTMASCHDGTPLANGIIKLVPFLDEMILKLLQIAGIDRNDTVGNIYDVMLDQYGLIPRQEDESFQAYWDRTKAAIDNFYNTAEKDFCLWDLAPEGAMEQNAWVHAQDNIYYFSYGGEASHPKVLPAILDNNEHHEAMDSNSFIAWMITGTMIGQYTCNDDRYSGSCSDGDFYDMDEVDRVPIDSSWWQNDGVVSTISMSGPKLYPPDYTGEKDLIVDWDGESIPQFKGVWNYAGVLENVDHFDITGLEFMVRDNHDNPGFDHIEDWYIERADFLKTLP